MPLKKKAACFVEYTQFSLSFPDVRKHDCLQERVPDKDRYRFLNIIRTMTPSRLSKLRSQWKLRFRLCLMRDIADEILKGTLIFISTVSSFLVFAAFNLKCLLILKILYISPKSIWPRPCLPLKKYDEFFVGTVFNSKQQPKNLNKLQFFLK